jgi:hypothetical protein
VALLLAHSDWFAHCIIWLLLHCVWTICQEGYLAFLFVVVENLQLVKGPFSRAPGALVFRNNFIEI